MFPCTRPPTPGFRVVSTPDRCPGPASGTPGTSSVLRSPTSPWDYQLRIGLPSTGRRPDMRSPPGWATRTTATARPASASTMARPMIRSRGGKASGEERLTDGSHDFRIETRIFLKLGDAFSLQALHHRLILIGATGAFVQPLRLQDLDIVDARDALSNLITEVGIPRPGNRALRDGLDDRARVLDGELLAIR